MLTVHLNPVLHLVNTCWIMDHCLFLTDVEYYFLPGEHYVVNVIKIVGAFNFSLIGFGLPLPTLIFWSESYVKVANSYNVTIGNLVFRQYSSEVISEFGLDVDAGLFCDDCIHCKVEGIWFYGYGFAGINLFQNSSINNITIDLSVVFTYYKKHVVQNLYYHLWTEHMITIMIFISIKKHFLLVEAIKFVTNIMKQWIYLCTKDIMT